MFKNSFAWIVLPAFGGCLGAFIILFGYADSPASEAFVHTPGFLLWLFLIILLMALLALFAGPLWLSLKPLQEYFKRGKYDIILSTILTIVLFIVPGWVNRTDLINIPLSDLQYHPTKIFFILLFSLITIIPGFIGMLLVREGAQAIRARVIAGNHNLDYVELIKKYLQFRDILQQTLFILGLLVGLVTLTTGALRNAVIASAESGLNFPSMFVIIYGLYYTALIALLYAPAYLSLVETGRTIRDSAFPFRTLDNLAEDTKKRTQLEELLQLNIRTEQSLRAGIAILAPLLTSLASSILGFKL